MILTDEQITELNHASAPISDAQDRLAVSHRAANADRARLREELSTMREKFAEEICKVAQVSGDRGIILSLTYTELEEIVRGE